MNTTKDDTENPGLRKLISQKIEKVNSPGENGSEIVLMVGPGH